MLRTIDTESIPPATERQLGAMPDAWLEILRKNFNQLTAGEEHLHEDADAEPIHQARIATRRLRVALRILRQIAEPTLLEPMETGLRLFAAALGRVRDQDVFLEWLNEFRESTQPESAPALDFLASQVGETRKESYRELVILMQNQKHQEFLHAFEQFIELPPIHPKRSLESLMARRIDIEWKKVRKLARAIKKVSPLAELHALRIAAKRLRYALEFADSFRQTPRANLRARMIRKLVKVQDTLGKVHDVHVHLERIDEILIRNGNLNGLQKSAHEIAETAVKQLHASEKQALRKFKPLRLSLSEPKTKTKMRRLIRATKSA